MQHTANSKLFHADRVRLTEYLFIASIIKYPNVPDFFSWSTEWRKKFGTGDIMVQVESIVESLKLGRFERVSIQVHDTFLEHGPELVERLQKELPNANVSLLGDSVTQCCLDEVAAEHYGCDCIVKIGHTCWFASQRMVSYFIPVESINPLRVLETVQQVRKEDQNCHILVFVNTLEEASLLHTVSHNVFICISPTMSYPGSNQRQPSWLLSRPLTSRVIPLIYRRFFSTCSVIKIAGRLVFPLDSSSSVPLNTIADNLSTRIVVCNTPSDSLFPRLVQRFGTYKNRVRQVIRSDSVSDTNYKELLRRYRGVEAVKFASIVGIVVTHCAASRELFQVRDYLSQFLRAGGKEVHMFSMGRVDGVKLGNFPEVDCFIILSCPESVYFESNDLDAEITGPFEALVAMDALEWSDFIVTDYDDMLSKMVTEPPPRTPRTPRRRPDRWAAQDAEQSTTVKLNPAKIEMGLRGIPSRYTSEPPNK
jgi:diphthamide biosynthesis protein 2